MVSQSIQEMTREIKKEFETTDIDEVRISFTPHYLAIDGYSFERDAFTGLKKYVRSVDTLDLEVVHLQTDMDMRSRIERAVALAEHLIREGYNVEVGGQTKVCVFYGSLDAARRVFLEHDTTAMQNPKPTDHAPQDAEKEDPNFINPQLEFGGGIDRLYER